MICPVCGGQLRAVDRSGIEIDICPQCKGVWLDSGELEKLLQREAQLEADPAPMAPRIERHDERQYHREHDDDDDEHGHDDRRYRQSSEQEYRGQSGHNPQQRRRGSWLGDLLGGIGGGED